MNLLDGLNHYKQRSNSDWEFTQEVENSANEVLRLISQYDDRPNSSALAAAHALLVEIEKWKAMCLQERMGNAQQNSQEAVWNAFRGALTAQNDRDAILSIMQLKGFGSSRDQESGQRRAKVATAALRFLKPQDWGVVDWRTIAMLLFLDKGNADVDRALMLAREANRAELKNIFDIVDENEACEVNRKYRDIRTSPLLSRAVDVEMAVFGLSLMAWPLPKLGT